MLMTLFIQGDQLNMDMYFLYLVKSDLSSVYVYSSVKSLSTRYQKNTVMLNWSRYI